MNETLYNKLKQNILDISKRNNYLFDEKYYFNKEKIIEIFSDINFWFNDNKIIDNWQFIDKELFSNKEFVGLLLEILIEDADAGYLFVPFIKKYINKEVLYDNIYIQKMKIIKLF